MWPKPFCVDGTNQGVVHNLYIRRKSGFGEGYFNARNLRWQLHSN